jgi:hypothetical protein
MIQILGHLNMFLHGITLRKLLHKFLKVLVIKFKEFKMLEKIFIINKEMHIQFYQVLYGEITSLKE